MDDKSEHNGTHTMPGGGIGCKAGRTMSTPLSNPDMREYHVTQQNKALLCYRRGRNPSQRCVPGWHKCTLTQQNGIISSRNSKHTLDELEWHRHAEISAGQTADTCQGNNSQGCQECHSSKHRCYTSTSCTSKSLPVVPHQHKHLLRSLT